MDSLIRAREELFSRLEGAPSGSRFCSQWTAIADQVVANIVQEVGGAFPRLEIPAIIATGGYGRCELAPHSDVDVCIVPLNPAVEGIDGAVKLLFRQLHAEFDRLNVKVGYRFALLNDVPALDTESRTGLLDARLVAGSRAAFEGFVSQLKSSLPTGQFILAKREERERAEAKFNDTPLVVEPNLKDGAGGLRSLHCANWMRAALSLELIPNSPSYEFILTVRNLLHLKSGRLNDNLTRSKQAIVGELLGLSSIGLIEQVAQAGLNLDSQYRTANRLISSETASFSEGVFCEGGRIYFEQGCTASQAARGIALGLSLGLELSESPGKAIDGVSGPEIMQALPQGERLIRALAATGVLAQLLPEITNCLTLMPDDSTHEFTVYEHTLRAVRNLDSLHRYSFLSSVRERVSDLGTLYLAMLLHDSGKFVKGGPHSESGAALAHAVCLRWNLGPHIADDVEWLVREHLAMARYMRLRDVQLPDTIAEFAQLVGSVDRLAMLTLLTWADVNAVGVGIWTPLQETLLQDLYERTFVVLTGSLDLPDTAQDRRKAIRLAMKEDVDEKELEAFLDAMPPLYWAGTNSSEAKLHFKYVQQARAGSPVIDIGHSPKSAISWLTIACRDRPGLLSDILGVLYAFDLSVHQIRANTTIDDLPVALDSISISYSGRPVPAATERIVIEQIRTTLAEQASVDNLLRERGKDPDRQQQVFRYHFFQGSPSILEIQAPPGRGMAYRFSRLIAERGWNILRAQVGQWAGRGSASFYLEGPEGLAQIEQALAGEV